jgi:hypothetical protein
MKKKKKQEVVVDGRTFQKIAIQSEVLYNKLVT